jgi:hypothetical protein
MIKTQIAGVALLVTSLHFGSGALAQVAGGPTNRPVDSEAQGALKASQGLPGSLTPELSKAPNNTFNLLLKHKLGVANLRPSHFRYRIGATAWSAWRNYETTPQVTVSALGPQVGGCEGKPQTTLKWSVEMELGKPRQNSPSSSLPIIEPIAPPMQGFACLFIGS